MGDVTREFEKGHSTASFKTHAEGSPAEGSTLHPILLRFDDSEVFPPIVLGKREITVGRGQECDIVLESETVSRLHALICYENWDQPEEEPRCHLRDCGSKNGVFINNTRIHGETALRLRDIVRLGEVILGYFVRRASELGGEGQFISQLERRMLQPGNVRVRHKVDKVAVLLSVEGDSQPPIPCHAANLSLEGLGLTTEHLTPDRYSALLRQETPVHLTMQLPDSGGDLSLKGRIAWLRLDDVRRSTRSSLGVELSSVSPETLEILNQLFLKLG